MSNDIRSKIVDSVAAGHRELAEARKQVWPHKNEVKVKGTNTWKANMGGGKTKK